MKNLNLELISIDFEQEYMECWRVIDDLKVLLDKWDSLSEDEKLNILIGLKTLYNLKFDKAYSTFLKAYE